MLAKIVIGSAATAVTGVTILGFFGSIDFDLDLVNHFRVHLALAALVLFALALLASTVRLAAACGVLAVVNLITTLMTPSPAPAAGAAMATNKIVTLNLWLDNRDLSAVEVFLKAEKADVVVLQELGPRAGHVIVAGDFNATPWSLELRRFAEDAEVNIVPGFRPSWPARLSLPHVPFRVSLPQLPIDHVFVTAGMAVVEIRRGPKVGSDHLPIVAVIGCCTDHQGAAGAAVASTGFGQANLPLSATHGLHRVVRIFNGDRT